MLPSLCRCRREEPGDEAARQAAGKQGGDSVRVCQRIPWSPTRARHPAGQGAPVRIGSLSPDDRRVGNPFLPQLRRFGRVTSPGICLRPQGCKEGGKGNRFAATGVPRGANASKRTNYGSGIEKMNEWLREEVRRIRMEHKKVELPTDLSKLNLEAEY